MMMGKVPDKARREDFQDSKANKNLTIAKLNEKAKSQAIYDFREKIKVAVWVSKRMVLSS